MLDLSLARIRNNQQPPRGLICHDVTSRFQWYEVNLVTKKTVAEVCDEITEVSTP